MTRALRTRPVEPPKDIPSVLTVAEVAAALRIGLSTVYDLIHTGQLEGFSVSTRGRSRGAIRVTRRSVDQFLERSRLGPGRKA